MEDMNLHIVDISEHISSGAVNKSKRIVGDIVNTPQGWQEQFILSGGISYIFNVIHDFARRDKIVFVADRDATIKKAIYPDYKGNRERDENIDRQRALAEIILDHCGFEVLYEEGCESDDIIYTLCKKYQNRFKHTYVHVNDHDIFVNVSKKVTILPANNNGKIIDMENYYTDIYKDKFCPYNSISFEKVRNGCKSDNVRPLPREIAEKLAKAFNKDFFYEKMGNKEFMRATIAALFPRALDQFDVIYPLDVEIIPDFEKMQDIGRTIAWAEIVGNVKFPKAKIVPTEVEELKMSFFNSGY